MGCDSERNVESEIIDAMLDRSSDGVNMDIPARVLDSETKYRGAIFHVDDRRIALTRNNGDQIVIRRQVLVHAPCVVMLVHDCVRDTYLIEREYRAGIGRFTYGLPAGLIDHDEDPHTAALRELREETGVVADTDGDVHFDIVGDYYSSEGMTDELIDTICDTPEVLPYIDIPVQHCDARILKAMRRSGSRQELEDLFRDLRERIPGIVIRSTAMVGFPTETDDEFRDLIDFMDTVGFDYTSVFAYSQEEGSLAAKMEGQVDEEVKLERAQEAMDLAESLGFAATAAHVGERAQVIVDGIEETEDGAELIGHAWFQAPDSDGAVHLDASEASVGDILTVEFTDSFCYELIGHVVE